MKQKIVPHFFFLKGIRLNRKPNNFGCAIMMGIFRGLFLRHSTSLNYVKEKSHANGRLSSSSSSTTISDGWKHS